MASQIRVKTLERPDATGVADEPRGVAEMRRVDWVAAQPEGDVGLDRRRQVGRPAVVCGPGAVGALARADPSRRRGSGGIGTYAENLPQEQVLGVDGDVRLELTFPPAVGVLAGEQGVDRSE